MSEELKPVPCGCGGEAKVQRVRTLKSHVLVVMCTKCEIATNYYTTEAEAITAWNTAMGERKAKVTEVKTDDDVYDIKGVHTWCKEYRCEKCGFIQFAIEDHGRYTYCPSCGCRLEWE